MAKAREDSVLVNLRALRDIGEDRAREEQEQERLRLEQARRALAEAERLRRQEAERIVREAEEAKQRVRDEQARLEREAQLRLDEAERCARIDAEARLEQARLALEIEARARLGRGKKPVFSILAAVLLVLGAGGFGAYAYRSSQEAGAAQREAQRRLAELERAKAEMTRLKLELATANARRRAEIEADLERRAASLRALEAAGGIDQPLPPAAPRPRPVRPAATPAADTTLPTLCPPGKPMCKESEKR